MTDRGLDSFLRTSGAHRRALLTLGVGGVAAILGRVSAVDAKSGSGKRRKKRCKRQKRSCVKHVRNYCAGQGENAPFCEEDLLPCCETCNLGAAIVCVVDDLATLE